MYGSGVQTGMAIIAAIVRQIRQEHPVALSACAVVAVGTAARGAAVCRTGTTARLATRATSSACASPFSSLLQEKRNTWHCG